MNAYPAHVLSCQPKGPVMWTESTSAGSFLRWMAAETVG